MMNILKKGQTGNMLSSVALLLVFLSSFMVPAEAELDRIYFGDRDSENAHQFQGRNTTLIAPEEDGEKVTPRITSVQASTGTAPESTLQEAEQWTAGGKREWIEYEINKPIKLEQIEITWGGGPNVFLFSIKTSLNGENWEQVYSGRGREGKEKVYEFTPVRARHVKIVARGNTRWWRPHVFRIANVWIGDLPYPEAYRNVLAYTPGLDRACRRLVPETKEDEGAEEAWMRFNLTVDPDKQNYLTVKFWGSDRRQIQLQLTDENGDPIDQKGWSDLWEFAGTNATGGYPGRFIYRTYPIPSSMTSGKSEIRLGLKGNVQDKSRPSQGIYAAYTHADKFFTPPSEEEQGEPFEWGPARPDLLTPAEKEQKLKERARELIAFVMKREPIPTDQNGARRLKSLSDAYHAEWSDYHQDPEIVEIVKNALDNVVRRQQEMGVTQHMGGHQWWFHGFMARSFTTLGKAFEEKGLLDERINHDGNSETSPITRRKAYARYFKKGFDWRKKEAGGRREVQNQTIAVSMSLYRMQKALHFLNPERALPEDQAMRYVYESVGLAPFYAPWPRRDWVRAVADADYPFSIISPDGLGKEYTHASGYGESAVIRSAVLAEESGNQRVKERAADIARARVIMARRPSNDGAGYGTLRAEYTATSRGVAYPGPVRHLHSILTTAAILGDPVTLRVADLYLNRGFFTENTRQDKYVRRVDDYLNVRDMLRKRDTKPLPIEPDHPDYAWADEELGVFSIKHEDVMMHGSFLIPSVRLRGKVSPVARIHYTTPTVDRLADVMIDDIPASGETLAQIPPPPKLEEKFVDTWRSHDVRASLNDFYQFHYGDYVIAMNTTEEDTYREQTFEVQEPEHLDGPVREARDLVSGEMIDLTKPVKVEPRSTMILHLGD